MNKRKQPTSRKASPTEAARLLAKLLRLRTDAEDVVDVCTQHLDNAVTTTQGVNGLLRRVHGLMPWESRVTMDIMNSRELSTLTEHLISMPGIVFAVRDASQSGVDSLWLAVADPDFDTRRLLRQTVSKSISRVFPVGNSVAQVVAVQLSTCF